MPSFANTNNSNLANAIMDCDAKLFRQTAPGTWTPTVGACKLRVLKVNEEDDAKCQILVFNNMRRLVLNAFVLEGVPLSPHETTQNAFTTKFWPRTAVCSRRCLYCIKFIGDKAQVNANTFRFIWSIYSGVSEEDGVVEATIHDEENEEEPTATATVATAIVENVILESNTAAAEGVVNVKPVSLKTADDSDDESQGSANLLDTSDEDDDKVDVNCRFKNFHLNDEWDGEAVNESQGF